MEKRKRLMRRRELRDRTGYADITIYRLEQEGKFPSRVRLGPHRNSPVAWVEDEIEQWIEDRISERDG